MLTRSSPVVYRKTYGDVFIEEGASVEHWRVDWTAQEKDWSNNDGFTFIGIIQLRGQAICMNSSFKVIFILYSSIPADQGEQQLVRYMRTLPMFHDSEYASKGAKDLMPLDLYASDSWLLTPVSEYGKRVLVTVMEFQPLLDSSNTVQRVMTCESMR